MLDSEIMAVGVRDSFISSSLRHTVAAIAKNGITASTRFIHSAAAVAGLYFASDSVCLKCFHGSTCSTVKKWLTKYETTLQGKIKSMFKTDGAGIAQSA
jgi:hypothetical protein